uniref:Reverse transcriptase domain-containing protein n=1 Tax=Nicotiana tabacum TaxID=4097 RepID=A0A1S4AID7_TOBAC|nr:PREDICTED: uncharacterized protein LOC107798003 [Nicotiana tabacum]
MYKAINYTTLTLLPKIANPNTVKDYSPINCFTILYKLAVKVLAGRLQKIMNYIISEAQESFFHGRRIAGNIILAHELVLEGLSFPDKFIKWLMTYVRTLNHTILLNGESVEPFNDAKGLRQGDPISPFLGDTSPVQKLHECFTIFSTASGLQENLAKSSIYCGGIESKFREAIYQTLDTLKDNCPLSI